MNLVINSTFKPRSFDDLMKLPMLYTETWEKEMDKLDDLTDQTEYWKNIANKENSPEAYKLYKEYSDQLNSVAEDFSKGMTMQNRRAARGLKRGYASNIKPIEDAYKAMQEANKLRDEASPDTIFTHGRYSSIDDFLGGKTANNDKVSRKDITSRTATLAQAAVADIINDPIIRQSMNPQFLEVIQRGNGVTFDQLQQAVAGSAPATNRLMRVKQQMYDDIGINNFKPGQREQVESAINQGLYAGLSASQLTLQKNSAYTSPAEAARLAISQAQERRAQYDWEANKGLRPVGRDQQGNDIYYNSVTGKAYTKDSQGIVTNVADVKPDKSGKLKPAKPAKINTKIGGEVAAVGLKNYRGEYTKDDGTEMLGSYEYDKRWGKAKVPAASAYKGSEPVNFDDLSMAEQLWLTQNYPQVFDAPDNFLFGRKYVKWDEKEGKFQDASEGDSGAQVMFVVKDKSNR